MKRMIVVWTAILMFSMPGGAQEKLSTSQSMHSDSTKSSPNLVPTEDQRIKALEDQVQLLTQQLSALRGELTSLREASTAAPESGPRVVLTSVHSESATPSEFLVPKATAVSSPPPHE